jgi:hypothetical protein
VIDGEVVWCGPDGIKTLGFSAISLFMRPLVRIVRPRSAISCGAPCFRVSAVNSRFSASSIKITSRSFSFSPCSYAKSAYPLWWSGRETR